eukprot:TRINITY_DN172_c0_g1_i1.p1 TRINITY_DN172_c0_g1~~TRINITY_DN172_c0_g1_i1.p1  ORF type:complete len:184 (-),score=46.83 TRINITY_DN172_c0_g1_i1:126-677(-)
MFKLFILSLFVFFATTQAGPSLIVRKGFGLSETTLVPTVGKDLVVTLEVFNVGDSSAYEVVVEDDWAADRYELVSGLFSAKWDEIPAGGNVTHVFVVQPTRAGEFRTVRAVARYADADKYTYTSFSTHLFEWRVYDLNEVDKRTGAHLKEWFIFLILSAVTVAGPYYYYNEITTQYQNLVKQQ